MSLEEIFLNWIDRPRAIYQAAELFPQLRKKPQDYLDILKPNLEYNTVNGVLDCLNASKDLSNDWQEQNEKFLRYHKSLTPHTFFNSIPIDHYIGLKTQLAFLKGIRVADIGGGTGHFLSSFFRHPHDIEYFLVDPNVRELHDQFVRMYPELLEIPMAHIRANAEDLPFISETMDLVISSSAIDHYDDYKIFISEAFRILKPQGQILISSHLKKSARKKSKSGALLERGIRILHRIKNRVALDDHTVEFESIKPIEDSLKAAGFKVEQAEIFKNYFFVVARK